MLRLVKFDCGCIGTLPFMDRLGVLRTNKIKDCRDQREGYAAVGWDCEPANEEWEDIPFDSNEYNKIMNLIRKGQILADKMSELRSALKRGLEQESD